MIERIGNREETRFREFDLTPLLPEGTRLIWDSELDVVIQLCGEKVIEVQRFTRLEMVVVVPFLENYPDYCPQEIVLSALTGKPVSKCLKLIEASVGEIGTRDPVMKPVRNQLGRLRLKLRPFGIEVKSIQQMGYLLIPLRAQTYTKERRQPMSHYD